MVEVKRIDELNREGMKVKDVYRMLASRKSYLIKVEDTICLTDDYLQMLIRKFADVPTELVEVYELNTL